MRFFPYPYTIPIPWQKILLRKKNLSKGMLFSDNTCIFFGCRLLVCIKNWSYTSSQNGQFAFPSQGVMEIAFHMWRKQILKINRTPTHQDISCIKIQPFFNGFRHYSQCIDYFAMNFVPQLAKKVVMVSDSPVPVAKIDTACKSNISIFRKRSRKCWY